MDLCPGRPCWPDRAAAAEAKTTTIRLAARVGCLARTA
jgi:hypothetical protein